MRNSGWIKLFRQIVDHQLWQAPEPFDKRSAWIDLLLMVNHEDREILIGNQSITVHRGQKWTSIRGLAERWHWSQKRTLSYLRMLEGLGMITKDGHTKGTLLTIVKYDDFQGRGQTKETQKKR